MSNRAARNRENLKPSTWSLSTSCLTRVAQRAAEMDILPGVPAMTWAWFSFAVACTSTVALAALGAPAHKSSKASASPSSPSSPSRTCSQCGGSGHWLKDCPLPAGTKADTHVQLLGPMLLAVLSCSLLASGEYWEADAVRIVATGLGCGGNLVAGLLPLTALKGFSWAPLSGGKRFALLQILGWTVMGFTGALSILGALNLKGRPLEGLWQLLGLTSTCSAAMLLKSVPYFNPSAPSPPLKVGGGMGAWGTVGPRWGCRYDY